mmetsp:Transcript_2790/g.6632  ORF Transcript_2790/g.6632 Transcript_2790/m.6632 type:complete len:232 (-) Transcript_2790:102-797(-)
MKATSLDARTTALVAIAVCTARCPTRFDDSSSLGTKPKELSQGRSDIVCDGIATLASSSVKPWKNSLSGDIRVCVRIACLLRRISCLSCSRRNSFSEPQRRKHARSMSCIKKMTGPCGTLSLSPEGVTCSAPRNGRSMGLLFTSESRSRYLRFATALVSVWRSASGSPNLTRSSSGRNESGQSFNVDIGLERPVSPRCRSSTSAPRCATASCRGNSWPCTSATLLRPRMPR